MHLLQGKEISNINRCAFLIFQSFLGFVCCTDWLGPGRGVASGAGIPSWRNHSLALSNSQCDAVGFFQFQTDKVFPSHPWELHPPPCGFAQYPIDLFHLLFIETTRRPRALSRPSIRQAPFARNNSRSTRPNVESPSSRPTSTLLMLYATSAIETVIVLMQSGGLRDFEETTSSVTWR